MNKKKIKIYLCIFSPAAFTKQIEEWYSLGEKEFKKFLEDVVFAREKPLEQYGKKLSTPPYYKFKKNGKQEYTIREKEKGYTYIFHPNKWDTNSFLEAVSKIHPVFYNHLISVNFTLEQDIRDIDESLVIDWQNSIQESILREELKKIQQSNFKDDEYINIRKNI